MPAVRRLVVATRNRHKLQEIRAILAGLPLELRSLDDYPPYPEAPEAAPDFVGNARIKAEACARATGEWSLGDDSGLEVDALGGRPGVLSARYAGVPGDAARNNAKLLDDLAGVPEERRGARFVCVVVVATPQGASWMVRGSCEGRILDAPRGSGGFGYDPLFLVPQYGATFAELVPDVKNRASHRACALARLREILPDLLR